MKKLALSLVLTLGVSGMALANNGSRIEDGKKNGCSVSNVTRCYNECGDYLGSIASITHYSNSECESMGLEDNELRVNLHNYYGYTGGDCIQKKAFESVMEEVSSWFE